MNLQQGWRRDPSVAIQRDCSRRHIIRTLRYGLLMFLLMASVVGCEPAEEDSSAAAPAENAQAESESITEQEATSLKPVDQAGLDALVKQHQGKVVLFDFWATWCGPCIEKLPKVVELQEKYADQGLVVYGVCIGNHTKEDQVTQAQRVLRRVGANFRNLISNHEKDEAAFNDFNLTQVPYYRLYSRDGELVGEYEGLPKDVEKFIEETLSDQ